MAITVRGSATYFAVHRAPRNVGLCEGFRMPAASNRATNTDGRRTKTSKGRNRALGYTGRAAPGRALRYGDLSTGRGLLMGGDMKGEGSRL